MKQFKCSSILKALTALVLALLMVSGTVATSFAAVVDDLAESGAEAEIADSGAEMDIAESGWTESKCYAKIGLGITTLTDYYMKNNKITFYNPKQQTVYFRFVAEGTNYGNNGDTVPDGSSSSANYYAKTAKGTTNFSKSLSAGTYVIEYTNRYDNNATLEYRFYRKKSGAIGAADANIISGSQIMFYIQSYNGTNIQLTNSSKTLCSSATYTNIVDGTSTVRIAPSDLLTYNRITNNPKNWEGQSNQSSYISGLTNGGATVWDKGDNGHNDAKTAPTTLSSTSIVSGTSSITLTTTASSNLSTYDDMPLCVQYYVDGTLTATVAATGASQTYTLTTSSLSTGDHTIKTVLTDGNVYYVTDTDTLTVNSASTPSIDTFTIDGGSSKALDIFDTATLTSTKSNSSNNVTYSVTEGSDIVSLSGTTGTVTVTALKPGNATITASLTGATSKTVTVSVNTPSLSFNYTPSSIYVGGATATPSAISVTNAKSGTTASSVSYSVTSGTSYASVNSSGTVTSKSTAGSVTVTASATITDGTLTYSGVTGTAAVNVKNRETVYLLGLTNEYTWNADSANQMTYNSTTGLYEITRNLYQGSTTYNGDNGFKLYVDSSYYGKNSTTLTSSATSASGLSASGGNIYITTKDLSSASSTTVPYKFTYDTDTKTVTVYYPMKVTYNMQSHGTNPSANGYVVAYGSTITAPTAPTATGYTFGGWYKEAACTNAWNFTTDTVTADTVLYAKWTAESKTLTVQARAKETSSDSTYGSSAASIESQLKIAGTTQTSASVEVGSKVTIAAPATDPSGYVWVGWYDGSTRIATSRSYSYTMATTAKTLTARYDRKYTLTISNATANGTLSKTSVITYYNDTPASFTVTPSAGYRFKADSSTNLSSYYTVPSGTTGTLTMTGKSGSSITAANKVNKTISIAYEELTPVVTFGARKTDDGNGYSLLSDAVTATYSTGSSSSGSGSESETPSYYLVYGNTSNDPSTLTSNIPVYQDKSGGKYTAKLTIASANTNYYMGFSTSTSYTNMITTATVSATNNHSGVTTAENQHYNKNNKNYYMLRMQVSSANTVVYITFDSSSPNSLTINSSYSNYNDGSDSGSSSGSSSGSASSGNVTSGGTVPYNANVTFTAKETMTDSGASYQFAGWYTSPTPVTGEESLGTALTYTKSSVTDDVAVYARYKRVYYITLYNSYEEEGEVGNKTYKYLTSPPSKVDVTRGTSTITYTYAAGALVNHTQRGYENIADITGGSYYEGNKIPVYAGDTVKLYYTALASSDTITAIDYSNTTVIDGVTVERHYTVEGEDNVAAHDDWDYTYESDSCLWADANYYPAKANVINNQDYDATVNNDSHTVEWTVAGDYLNIDLELATKRQITFKDTTGLTITTKNTDNYYSVNEDLSTSSTTGLKAVAATSDSCTYTVGTPSYYDENGTDITSTLTAAPYNFAYNTTSGKFTGKMPNYDVVIDMNVTTTYSVAIGSWMVADPINGSTAGFNKWNKVASVEGTFSDSQTQSDTKYDVADSARAAVDAKSITKGTSVTYATSLYNDYKNDYLFLGWYKGTSSAPDMVNGLLSKKMTDFVYTPKANTYVWAVGTRMMYIGGSFYDNGGEITYIADGDSKATWKNHIAMTWDPVGNRYSYTFDTVTTQSGGDGYHFRIYETATSTSGTNNTTIWDRWQNNGGTAYDNDYNGSTHTLDYGRYYADGKSVGWFRVDSDVLAGGYAAPVTVYFYPNDGGIEVSATYQWKKIYVSSGLNAFDGGEKVNSNNTSSTPSKTATVTAKTGTTIATGSKSWNPDGTYTNELNVQEYYVKTKNGTVTVTKEVASGFKVAAFVVYEYEKHNVYAVDAVKDTDTKYHADIQITENCYIYPVLESTSADMTVYVNSVDIDTTKWGDLVSLYAWNTSNADMNGVFPGQLMIPSADGKTWYANIVSTNLRGITFSNNFKDMWLQNQVTYSNVIPTYNTISGHSNVTAQTYDYREPKPLMDIAKKTLASGEKVILSFSLKDGNINLTGFNGVDGNGAGTVNATFYNNYYQKNQTIDPSQFHYLTNRDHTKYTDLNGEELTGKPTASFYVICKANTNYVNGVNQSKNTINYSSIDTYSGKWSVDWFVYDASGNYITSILSAGYADRVGDVQSGLTRVAEAVHNAGYAYEDRAVGISYDFPQSYDSNTLYRFSGQWISTATTTPVTLNVKVGMKLGEDEDGPIMDVSNSNSETYGTASASYTGSKTAIETGAGYVTIRLSDAENKPVQVTATNENNTFLGWYTYNEKTETYEEVPGSSLTFNPAFNMDTTIYAIYEAKATYRFKYTAREADGTGSYDKYYTVSASNLTPAEVSARNIPNLSTVLESGETRLQEAQRLAPTAADIAVFKKTATVNKTTCTSSAYTLTFDCTTNVDTYSLTYYYYKGANGTNWDSASVSGAYNTGVDIPQATKDLVVANAPTGKKFAGWYTAQNGGTLLSKQANFGMAIISNTTVYAHYETDPTYTFDSTPTCEENILTKELTSADSGIFYNDFLCKFQNNDGSAPTASNCGILIIYQDDLNTAFSGSQFTETQYSTVLNSLRQAANKGKAVRSTGKNSILFNISVTDLSVFSRADLVFKSDFAEFNGRKYIAVPYVYNGSSYVYGSLTSEQTYH